MNEISLAEGRRYKWLLTWAAAASLFLLANSAGTGFAEEGKQPRLPRRLFPPARIENSLESPEREKWQKSGQVIEALALKKGAAIADIGAGSGYFAFRLADAVGPTGKVYAVDIQEEMLDYIRRKISTNGVKNVVPVRSSETDSKLPAACCDKIILVNTYHELSNPVALMKNLRNALKPGGSIAIINWRKTVKRPSVSSDEIIAEMKSAGFTLSATHDFLERQFFLVFTPD